MKKNNIIILFLLSLTALWGCKKENYPGGVVSPYISAYDIRNIYKGSDVTLTVDNMFGSDKITGVVVSDHTGGNLPDGLLIVQDKRRLSQQRGLAIPIGSAASNYLPGDSVVIEVTGAMLTRVDGILQLTGITEADITKVSSGGTVEPLVVKASSLVSNPGDYESTLVSVAKVGFDPTLPAGTTYAGDKLGNDGFGNFIVHTEATADYASKKLPFLANFTGIVFRNGTDTIPRLRPRTGADIIVLSATPPKVASIVIAGYLQNPTGSDANYEYIQFMATRDIDFAVTPFAVVTTNNAGANTPQGFPANGWATGDLRTYKINLTSGAVMKGQYFYVGGNKNIWGGGSNEFNANTIWFSKMYATNAGDDFGTPTSNLLANSGNAAGIAVFDTLSVDAETIPIDVIFYGGNGSVFTDGPPAVGYRITNTDYYDITHPTTFEDQPFFNQGSNTGKLTFTTTENFAQLGGVYNISSARWTTARSLTAIPITTTSTEVEIEGATMVEE